MAEPTFCTPDLDTFCLLDRLGLTVTGQQVGADHTVLACRVVEPDDVTDRDCWCQRCGAAGVPRDSVVRKLAQDTTQATAPRAKLTAHAVLWALRAVVIDRASIARVAASLGASWHTVNDAVLAAGRALLINDPARLDGVKVLGVDEHCWRHPAPAPVRCSGSSRWSST